MIHVRALNESAWRPFRAATQRPHYLFTLHSGVVKLAHIATPYLTKPRYEPKKRVFLLIIISMYFIMSLGFSQL